MVVVSSLIAVGLTSLVSLVGIIFLFFKTSSISRFTHFLVSVAAGALLGDAFIHLIPEAFDFFSESPNIASLLIILGVLIFFSIEKFVRWRHCHSPEDHDDCDDHVVPISLVGDIVHNFTDGVIIAAGFMASPAIGIATTLAVVLHEIPQEIGDFSLFLHYGLSFKKSLILNLLSSLASVVGAVLTLIIGASFADSINFLLPITAGGFIYLSLSDLIPELHRHRSNIGESFVQLLTLIIGICLMYLLLLVE